MIPGPLITVPPRLSAQLAASAERGVKAAGHAPSDTAQFERWSLAHFPARPRWASDAHELRQMHQIKAARTPEQTATANWFAYDGDKGVWDGVLADWQKTVGPAQAKWGAELLTEARDLNSRINAAAKQLVPRNRPYVTDPSIDPVVPTSNANSPSYPSGHSARAFMEATLMSALVPARRTEFLQVAEQMAMSRVYGGVHYPSDTVGGAWEGALVATWLLQHRPRPA